MVLPGISDRLLAEVEKLGTEDQYRVLDFVRALAEAKPKGPPGNRLLDLSGTLDSEQADQISAAIEEGCEQVDLREW